MAKSVGLTDRQVKIWLVLIFYSWNGANEQIKVSKSTHEMEKRTQRRTQSISRNITGKHYTNDFYYFIRFILLKLSYLINNY